MQAYVLTSSHCIILFLTAIRIGYFLAGSWIVGVTARPAAVARFHVTSKQASVSWNVESKEKWGKKPVESRFKHPLTILGHAMGKDMRNALQLIYQGKALIYI